jgi:hypothetical protein
MTMVDSAVVSSAGTRHFRVLRVEANADPPDGRRGIDFAVSSIPAKPRMVKGMDDEGRRSRAASEWRYRREIAIPGDQHAILEDAERCYLPWERLQQRTDGPGPVGFAAEAAPATSGRSG